MTMKKILLRNVGRSNQGMTSLKLADAEALVRILQAALLRLIPVQEDHDSLQGNLMAENCLLTIFFLHASKTTYHDHTWIKILPCSSLTAFDIKWTLKFLGN